MRLLSLAVVAVAVTTTVTTIAEATEGGTSNTATTPTKNEAQKVRIDRDDKGVWYVTGPDDAPMREVFGAVGYAVATDRLWQIELFRRTGQGRLSELFGEDLLDSDILMRTTGYSESELNGAFEAMTADERDILLGYVDGINRRLMEIAGIGSNATATMSDPAAPGDASSLFPFEFAALGIGNDEIEPWTVNQVLAWAVVMQRGSDSEAYSTTQIENAALLERLSARFGEDTAWTMFNDLRWTRDPAALTAIDYEGKKKDKNRSLRGGTTSPKYQQLQKKVGCHISNNSSASTAPRTVEREVADHRHHQRRLSSNVDIEDVAGEMKTSYKNVFATLDRIQAIVKLGSYGWVVAGNHTKSGSPTLYGGSQLGLDSAPSFVAEGSIQAGGLQVSGEVIPGIPIILDTVRTPYNAWAFEVANAHTTDYYLEEASEVSLHRVEIISVAGRDGEDVELPVYRGRHGPVVREIDVGDNNTKFLTWKYSHWDYELRTLGAILKMLKATNIHDFEAGVHDLGLSVHVVYADRDGSIAYWMSGRDPIRNPDGEWRLPQGMGESLSVYEWDSAVIKPFPTDKNTPRGWYGNWNNKASIDSLTGFNSVYSVQGPFHGVHAIYEYLDELVSGTVSDERISFDQIRDVALNIAVTESGTPWFFIEQYFRDAVNRAGISNARASALELLDTWDGKFVAGGKPFWINGTERAQAWVLSTSWISEVLNMVFFDELAVPTASSGTDAQPDLELVEPEGLLFNVLLHSLDYPGSLTNGYDWFTNLNDTSEPQDADSIIVAALDKVLAAKGNNDTYDRGYNIYEHNLIGEVWRAPYLNRGTYDQIVEVGPDGPVRIERYVAPAFAYAVFHFAMVSSHSAKYTEFALAQPLPFRSVGVHWS